MAGLSIQEFLNCTRSPLEIVEADLQIKADLGSRDARVFFFCLVTSLLAKYQIRCQISFEDHVVHE
jgi:hypothetical protein